MRLLHIFHDDRHAKRFSAYLKQQGIENNLEISKNNDWESENYGDPVCKIWIIDEDQVTRAKTYLESYRDNPDKSEYVSLRPEAQQEATPVQPPPPPKKRREQELGKASFVCIFLCALILFISMITRATFQPFPSDLPAAPLFLSNLEKEFYFDYPKAYELVDKLDATYGLKGLIERKTLPPEGIHTLEEYQKTPYWTGIYPLLVRDLKGEKLFLTPPPPLFEKIREGQLGLS